MTDNLPQTRKIAIQIKSQYYFTGISCKNGHITKRYTSNSLCQDCLNISNKTYPVKNKDKMNGYKRKWRINNSNKCKEYKRNYYIEKSKNPLWKLNGNVSHAIWKCLKQDKNHSHWEDLVDFTLDELKEHLESKFCDGMTWENYGSYWHVDHIKPLSLCSTFEEAWTLQNLQPLEAIENIRKGNRYEDRSIV